VKIRTITVDFWGTLLFDGPGSDNRYKRRRMADFEKILTAEGMAVTAAALDRAYEQSGHFLAGIWATYRDVPVDAHVKAIVDALEPGRHETLAASTRAALVDAYASPALLVPPTVDAGALAALEALGARGYTLALISNTMRTPGATLRKLLERYRLLDRFKHTTFSDEVGIRKPDAKIFHLTLQAVGGDVETSVHVGDDSILDVGGARAAGMCAIQVTEAPRRARGPLAPVAVIPSMSGLPDAIAALDR
jgi:putative hydrolase of the HAD superfamily